MDVNSADLELADQAALELHGQLAFPLWNSHDPNLFRLGKFRFTVDMKKLASAVYAITIPHRSSDHILIEITSSTLLCVGNTQDMNFSCSASIPLSKDSEIGPTPICFEIHRKRLKGLCEAFKHTVIEFEFDKNENKLSFVLGEEHEKSFQLSVEWCPMVEEPLSSPFLFELPDTDLLKRAIYYVTPMSMGDRAPPPQYPGIQFADRTAFSGYSRGRSKFHSAALPDGKFNLPRREIRNIRSILGRLMGRCTRFMTHDRSGFKSEVMSCSWKTTSDWPAIPTRPFEVSPIDSIQVPASEFLNNIALAAITLKEVTFQIKHNDSGDVLELLAIEPTASYWAMIHGMEARAPVLETDEQETTPSSVLTFKLRDLKEIMQWDTEANVTVGLGENTLILLQGDGKEFIATSILAGKARN
jgi:hypothetical protein